MDGMKRQRMRDLGVVIGELSTGALNAITDVAEVSVGQISLISGDGPLKPGIGPVRTGVTVIIPHPGNLFQEKVRAAVHTINGFGKACGFEQVRELGLIEAPIALTNTLNVGLVLDALVQSAICNEPAIGIRTSTVNIVVGETNDGYLNDIQGRHVKAEHVWDALAQASTGPVAEGSVGAGTGTCCFGWKGGIGTSSRVLPDNLGGFTLGALVQTNFGRREDLSVCGVLVGKHLVLPDPTPEGQGSVMIILATDAPLNALQMERLCVRAGVGLARTGSRHDHASGDFVIAFTTAYKIAHSQERSISYELIVADEESVLNGLFQAVVESVEEAVLNSLSAAGTMIGRDNHVAHGLPLDQLQDLLRRERVL
jgi:D-aminopeptidase